MLSELRADNRELIRLLRMTHKTCEEHNDIATANMVKVWIDETERPRLVPLGGGERRIAAPPFDPFCRLSTLTKVSPLVQPGAGRSSAPVAGSS